MSIRVENLDLQIRFNLFRLFQKPKKKKDISCVYLLQKCSACLFLTKAWKPRYHYLSPKKRMEKSQEILPFKGKDRITLSIEGCNFMWISFLLQSSLFRLNESLLILHITESESEIKKIREERWRRRKSSFYFSKTVTVCWNHFFHLTLSTATEGFFSPFLSIYSQRIDIRGRCREILKWKRASFTKKKKKTKRIRKRSRKIFSKGKKIAPPVPVDRKFLD